MAHAVCSCAMGIGRALVVEVLRSRGLAVRLAGGCAIIGMAALVGEEVSKWRGLVAHLAGGSAVKGGAALGKVG